MNGIRRSYIPVIQNKGNLTRPYFSAKIEVRVEALLARKEYKSIMGSHRRDRSMSFVSSACSRAPSEFFANEDSRLLERGPQFAQSPSQSGYLKVPGQKFPPVLTSRRYAQSAEPYFPSILARSSSQVPKHSYLSHFTDHNPRHRRASSLTSIIEPPVLVKPSNSISNRINKLYPSLDDLAAEIRPKKAMPIKGRAIAAAVNKFEKIAEEHSIEIVKSRILKRKATEDSLLQEEETSKKARFESTV